MEINNINPIIYNQIKYIIHHSPGVILKLTEKMYVDQLDSSPTPWSGLKGKLILRLISLYNLSETEYVNLIFRDGKDKYLICHKESCDNQVESWLYVAGGNRIYCSRSCQVSQQQLNLIKSGNHQMNLRPDDFKSFQLKGTNSGIKLAQEASKIVLDKMLIDGVHPFKQRSTSHKASKSNFINRFSNRGLSGYLYITKYQNHIKFGVTSNIKGREYIPIDSRDSNSKEFMNNLHLIRSGDIEWIAELEYQIKTKLDPYNLGSTEIIKYDQLKDLLEIVRNYK